METPHKEKEWKIAPTLQEILLVDRKKIPTVSAKQTVKIQLHFSS